MKRVEERILQEINELWSKITYEIVNTGKMDWELVAKIEGFGLALRILREECNQ